MPVFRRPILHSLLLGLALVPGTARLEPEPGATDRANLGGILSVADDTDAACNHPAPFLDAKQGESSALGRQLLTNRWAFFWFENAMFGRRPISNAQSCTSGHADNGRAGNFVEAVLWHGGEAAVSRESFARLTRAARDALVAFLRSL